MTDREKVMKGFTCCEINASCTSCPYFASNTCIDDLRKDVFELLKKQSENVRCKDCRYSRYDGTGELLCCKHHGRHPEDWFCADGKVKQDG